MEKQLTQTKAEFLEDRFNQYFIESVMKFWKISKKEAEDKVWKSVKEIKNSKYICID